MPLQRLRSTAARLRDALDGLLHRRRRVRAEERLAALRPRSVLVICLGNVCRSPYAARSLATRAPEVRVDSAGFIGPDRAPPDTALEVAGARGVRHADHRSKTLTAELVRESDAVFVFDRFNVARLRRFGGADSGRVFWLGDFDPEWAGKRAIVDPWGKPAEEFERTFARIDRCLDEVARVLRG